MYEMFQTVHATKFDLETCTPSIALFRTGLVPTVRSLWIEMPDEESMARRFVDENMCTIIHHNNVVISIIIISIIVIIIIIIILIIIIVIIIITIYSLGFLRLYVTSGPCIRLEIQRVISHGRCHPGSIV